MSEETLRRCRACEKTFKSRYAVNFCSYHCYRRYKLPSRLERMGQGKIPGISISGIDTRDRCKILLHPNESLRHFITKALVCRILSEKRHSFVCEASVENGNRVDVCDLSLQIAYEIEPKKSDARLDSKFGKYGVSPAIKDIIIIPYEDLPRDIDDAYERLEELVV